MTFTKASRTICAFCFVLLTGHVAVAAHAAELTGLVRDPHSLVVKGAQVRLFREAERAPIPSLSEVFTDSEGRFHFSQMPAGSYRLEVSAFGFDRQLRELELGDALVSVEIRLTVAGVHEGVVVTATRREDETFGTLLPTALLSGRSLDRQLATNLAQALEEVPGVTWRNAGAFRSRPIIRGLDSNRVLVLVDGERLNNSRTSTSDAGIETSLIDLSQIAQVEVVRGPGSVLYGSDAFGGVVNILTRYSARSEGPHFGARTRGDFFSNSDARRGNVELFGGGRWFSVRAAGSVGTVSDYSSPLGTVFGSGADESGASGELRVYPSKHQSFFFKFLHQGAYDIGLPALDPNPPFFADFPFSKLQKFSWGYQGNFNSPLLSSLQARFYRQDQTRDFFNLLRTPGFRLQSDTVTDVKSFGFDIQATSLAKRSHVFTYGVSFYRDSNRDRRIQILNPDTNPRILSQAPSVPNSSLSGTGIFLQDQFEVAHRLRLTGGLRLDYFRLNPLPTKNFDPLAFSTIVARRSDKAVSGNVGASFDLRPGWVLTGNLARAFREPNLFERFFFGRGSVGGFVVPNPSLEPEKSVQFDLGTRVRRGPVRASLNYFRNELTDLTVRAPGTFMGNATVGGQPVVKNVNLDMARIQGMESSAEFFVNALGSQWTPFATVAWQRGTNRTNGDPLPLIAPFISQLGLRWQSRRFHAWSEWRARIVKGSTRVPPSAQTLEGFTVLGWRWGYELVRGEHGSGVYLPRGITSVNFHFALENVTNKLYRGLFETVPEPGRSFRIGLDLTFDIPAR